MRNNYKCIYALIIFLAFISCEKDDNYPKKFVRHHFVEGKLRMFTREGEVKNTELINKYIKRYRNKLSGTDLNDESKFYSFEDDVNLYENYNFELFFSSSTHGNITHITKKGNKTVNFNLISGDGYINLSMRDTLFCLENSDKIPIYKCSPEIINKKLLSPITGFDFEKTYFRPLYANQVNNEIQIFLVSYLKTKHFNKNLRQINLQQAVNNKINPDYISNFNSLFSEWRDTIVYKESYIVFKE